MHRFWMLANAWCRPPGRPDAPAVQDLLNDEELRKYGDSPPVSREEAEEICSGRYPWFLIFSRDNRLIGVVALLRQNGEIAEVCLQLRAAWRRRGIGKDVLARLEAVAHGVLGVRRLYARVLQSNPGAQRFFVSCGYEQAPELPAALRVPNEQPSRYYIRCLQPQTVKLSVLIPMYNCGQWIEECIDSLTGIPCEILVCDDHSTDNGAQIVRRLSAKDDRIQLFPLTGKRYAGAARNEMVSRASGDYLFFLDADDRVCDPEVCRRMSAAACYSRADMIYSGEIEILDTRGSHREPRNFRCVGPVGQGQRLYLFRNQHPIWMRWFRRDFVMEQELVFAESVPSYEDNLFSFMAAATAESVMSVPGALVSHRIRPDSLSHTRDISVQRAFLDVVGMQLEYAKEKEYLQTYLEGLEEYFFHMVFPEALRVSALPGPGSREVLEESIAFLRREFPELRDHTGSLKGRDGLITQFIEAWDDPGGFWELKFGTGTVKRGVQDGRC